MALSPEQRAALWDDTGTPVQRLQLLSARPGTGKTTTIADYCLDLAADWNSRREPWQGIAVLSYTNVAKDEIEARVRRVGAAHLLLRSPHFVGTLDAFINQHIFLPHGAKSMGYTGGRPDLVGEPYRQWKTPWALHKSSPEDAYKPVFFDCYTLGKDGQPLSIDNTPRIVGQGTARVAPTASHGNVGKITALKRHVWAYGMALQADANYLAYKTIRSSRSLAKALVSRFPVLVVDEAQDMTEVQHAIIDALVAAGLHHVVLVGDENQAIYEWNTARPDLFTARATADGWKTSVLKESYRCSPAICATLTAMANDGVTLVPATEAKNADYPLPVDVRVFDANTQAVAIREAIDSIAGAIANVAPHDGNEARIKTLAVVSRSGEDAGRLQAQYTSTAIDGAHRTIWDSALTREFLKTIHHLSNHRINQAVHAYEQLLTRAGNHSTMAEMRTTVMREASISQIDRVGYRFLLFADLTRIADVIPNGGYLRISDCADFGDLPLATLRPNHRAEIRRDCANFAETAKVSRDRSLPALFAARDERTWVTHASHPKVRIVFATAHAVKGETYDAVVLYTKHRVYACGCPQSAGTWKAVLQHSMLECETKRIAYVACSRAAQELIILTPVGSLAAWQQLANPAPKAQGKPMKKAESRGTRV